MDEWRDVTQYRLDQFEKRADAADARMARTEDKLTEVQVTPAKVATTDNVRNWGLVVVGAVLATGLSIGGLFLQSSSNQLSAFQAGLSAIRAITAAEQAGHPSQNPKTPPKTRRASPVWPCQKKCT